MADSLRLAMMTFPQTWDGAGTLKINVLLVPSIDPTVAPLIGANPATPSFANGKPAFSVVVIPSLAGLPKSTSAAFPFAPTIVSPPATPAATFAQLKSIATAQSVTIATPATPPAAVAQIRKPLPPSYLAAGGGNPNGTTTTSEDDFSCAVRAVPPNPKPPTGPKSVSWGELISYALRQPVLATSLGLRYELSMSLGAAHAQALAQGGWIYVTLAGGDPWLVAAATNPGSLLIHAARIPALDMTARPLFAAVQFLLDWTGGAPMDDALLAAETYADGFTKLVHCAQPDNADPSLGGSLAPGSDLGIQIGWDDEQVTTWQNGQLALLAARRGGTLQSAQQSPLGVLGYRVDVADVTPPAAGPPKWQSLVDVATNLPPPFGAFSGELAVEPMAAKPSTLTATDAWLPKYFATWRGGSLCEPDPVPRALASRTAPAPSARKAVNLTTLLSYGKTYAFRVRLADLSSGGPTLGAIPVSSGPAATGTQTFLRYVPPKAPALTSDGSAGPASLTLMRPVIGYPEVLYTSLGSTETARDALRAHMVTQAQTRSAAVAGVPDPDVDHFAVTVEIAHPLHDVGSDTGGNAQPSVYQTLYTTTRKFANLTGAAPLQTDPGTTLKLAYVAAPSILNWPSTQPDTGEPLVIPRGRNVRLTIRGLTRSTDPKYFAPQALQGHPTQTGVRGEAEAETSLLIADPVTLPIRGLLFRRPPGVAAPSVVAQLAAELDVLSSHDIALTTPPGQRVIFGASHALRHSLSADGETLTFGAVDQLLQFGVVAIVVDLARDWTWDGLTPQGITVLRAAAGGSIAQASAIGSLTVPNVLGPAATTRPSAAARGSTRLIFLDAVDPHEPTPAGFPTATALRWYLVPNPRAVPAAPPLSPLPSGFPPPPPGGSELANTPLDLTLPIAIPPTQVPAIASVGLAFSPYEVGTGYASTAQRNRALWIELTEPIANQVGDALFARVLAHGADPLLYQALPQTPPDANPPLALDPELVRVIFPNDTDDRAGESAMTKLTASPDSNRHFLLPLPPGVSADDPEQFGFYTYELRVGHSGPAGDLRWWSTANGRFGAPLRVVGVQHPAPALGCSASRIGHNTADTQKIVTALRNSPNVSFQFTPVSGTLLQTQSPQNANPVKLIPHPSFPNVIIATATFATPVLNGTPLVRFDETPRTSLWFFLYAQAVQMDGASMRNILLAQAPALFLQALRRNLDPVLVPFFARYLASTTQQRDRLGFAVFQQTEIDTILAALHLPGNAPLSVLAVELLPGGTISEPQGRTFNVAASTQAATGVATGRTAPSAIFPFGRIMRTSPLTPIAPPC